MRYATDAYLYDPRRFLVATDKLAIYSGVYQKGEVITAFQAGTARNQLLEQGMIAEMDYDLTSLGSLADGSHRAI